MEIWDVGRVATTLKGVGFYGSEELKHFDYFSPKAVFPTKR